MKIWVWVIGALLAKPILAGPATCEELNERWTSTYHRDFRVTWPVSKFSCPSETSKIAKAFDDLKYAKSGYDYYGWARQLVRGVRYSTTCPDLYGSLNAAHEITLCGVFFTTDDEGRVSTIVHEAAHARSDDTKHVPCRKAKEPEKTSCDEKLTEGFSGSGYNFDFMYYRHLRDAADKHWLNRDVLDGWIRYLVLNKFNQVSEDQVKRWAPAK